MTWVLQGTWRRQYSPSVSLLQPSCPHGQQPRLRAKQPAFILARGTLGDKHWPAWLHMSLFSLIRERWYAGAWEPSRRTLSAAAPHIVPASRCRGEGCVNSGGQRRMAQHLIWIYHRLLVGWGEKASGRACECLMHPATTQQFVLKSLLPIWKDRVKSKLTPDRMYNYEQRAAHEQLLEPHWFRMGLPGVRIWIINSRLFPPPPPPRPPPPPPPAPAPTSSPVLSKSYSISTGRSLVLPSSCNNCVPIVRKTSSWPPPYKWPLSVESWWLHAPPDALGDPAA